MTILADAGTTAACDIPRSAKTRERGPGGDEKTCDGAIVVELSNFKSVAVIVLKSRILGKSFSIYNLRCNQDITKA